MSLAALARTGRHPEEIARIRIRWAPAAHRIEP
jgi:hypothetical protein